MSDDVLSIPAAMRRWCWNDKCQSAQEAWKAVPRETRRAFLQWHMENAKYPQPTRFVAPENLREIFQNFVHAIDRALGLLQRKLEAGELVFRSGRKPPGELRDALKRVAWQRDVELVHAWWAEPLPPNDRLYREVRPPVVQTSMMRAPVMSPEEAADRKHTAVIASCRRRAGQINAQHNLMGGSLAIEVENAWPPICLWQRHEGVELPVKPWTVEPKAANAPAPSKKGAPEKYDWKKFDAEAARYRAAHPDHDCAAAQGHMRAWAKQNVESVPDLAGKSHNPNRKTMGGRVEKLFADKA